MAVYLLIEYSNFHEIEWNLSPLVSEWHPIFQSLISSGFKQLVNTPTHESGSLLDYAFVKTNLNYGADLHWPYYSDHAAVYLGELKSTEEIQAIYASMF